MKRVAIYVRTSTADEQDPQMQMRELKEWSKLRGWDVRHVLKTWDSPERIQIAPSSKGYCVKQEHVNLIWS